MTWSNDIEMILNKLRLKSLILSKFHKTAYSQYLNLLKYFRIPVILLSGVNSVFNVALNQLVPLETVSLLCCFLSLTVGLIGSIELFLQVQNQKELHLNNSTKYCILSNDISKILMLDIENRSTDGLVFLEDSQSQFNTLVGSSIVTDKIVNKKLLMIEANEDDYELLKLPSTKSTNSACKNSLENSI